MTTTAVRNPWSAADDATLRTLYAQLSARLIGEILGRPRHSVKNRIVRLRLAKPGANKGCFQPGQAAWNKGVHYQAGGRSRETQFKPGQRAGKAAHNYKPIGHERVSADGYLERKINDGLPLQSRWRAIHLINWEARNGPLPAGHALKFKDGNKANIDLANIELMTRADLMRRNGSHNYGKEITQIVQLRSAISRQINKRERQAK